MPMKLLVACVLLTLLGWTRVDAQCVQFEIQELLAMDADGGDSFGYSVAVDQDVALLGAYADDERGLDAGAAYVFRRKGSAWLQEAKLLAGDGAPRDWFGLEVSISGDVALVGAPLQSTLGAGAGAAYVFRFDGTNWVEEAKLLAPDGIAGDWFGHGLDVDGNLALIGARFHEHTGRPADSGCAYVYQYNRIGWIFKEELLPAATQANDQVGGRVAMDNGVALLGAATASRGFSNNGAAFVFRHDGSAWHEEQELIASDASDGDLFGGSVDLDLGRAVIGAFHDDDNGDGSGSVYTLRFDGARWREEQKLLPGNGSAGAEFGISVSMSSDRVLVGSRMESTGGPGVAHVFRLGIDRWVEQTELQASDRKGGDLYGYTVAIKDDHALVGAFAHGHSAPGAGSVYFHSIPDLSLDAASNVVPVGEPVTLNVCGGIPGAPVLLSMVAVNGLDLSQRITTGRFDQDGHFEFTGKLGLGSVGGMNATLRAFGYFSFTKVGVSNRETVTFQ